VAVGGPDAAGGNHAAVVGVDLVDHRPARVVGDHPEDLRGCGLGATAHEMPDELQRIGVAGHGQAAVDRDIDVVGRLGYGDPLVLDDVARDGIAIQDPDALRA